MDKCFAVFIGGPWDRRWDYVPRCDSFDVYDTVTREEHTYYSVEFALPISEEVITFYIVEDLDVPEAFFRLIVTYTRSPEDLE